MAKGFSINDILGGSVPAPAGQMMRVVMLPAADIEPNPSNAIYEIGDVSMLKADIAERGLRSPLEVLPAKCGKYMLIAGHRRWTACRELSRDGVTGFDALPCVIHESQGADDDLIALITSNATARELTDGERLRQYKALKQALERKKAAGGLDGRVRDEMSRITGDGAGTLGRLNAIINKCTPEVVEMVENGDITLTRAYECSKLYKVQQAEYAQKGYSYLPQLSKAVKDETIRHIVHVSLANQLKGMDYVRKTEWNYADNLKIGKMKPETVTLEETGAIVSIKALNDRGITIQQHDPDDKKEVIAQGSIYASDMYATARRAYVDPEALKKQKETEKNKRSAEQTRLDEAEKWMAFARQELADFDNWPLVARHKDIGLTIRSRDMSDGGKMYIAVDDLARIEHSGADAFPYACCFVCRYAADGQRVYRDGDKNGADYLKRWTSVMSITNYIADDLRRADRRSKK